MARDWARADPMQRRTSSRQPRIDPHGLIGALGHMLGLLWVACSKGWRERLRRGRRRRTEERVAAASDGCFLTLLLSLHTLFAVYVGVGGSGGRGVRLADVRVGDGRAQYVEAASLV